MSTSDGSAPTRQPSTRQQVKEEGNVFLSCCCCVLGLGALAGMIAGGIALMPADALDGTCWVDPSSTWHVSSECKHIGRSETPVINIVNVTLKDGSVRTCNTFRLSGHCDTLYSSDDAAPVLRGERRECKFVAEDDNRCLEPGMYGGEIAGAIACWICAPCLCCVFSMFAVSTCPVSDSESNAVSPESNEESNEDNVPQKTTSKMRIQHSKSKVLKDKGQDSGAFSVVGWTLSIGILVGLIIAGVMIHDYNLAGAVIMWILAPILCCCGCCFGLLVAPDSWISYGINCWTGYDPASRESTAKVNHLSVWEEVELAKAEEQAAAENNLRMLAQSSSEENQPDSQYLS